MTMTYEERIKNFKDAIAILLSKHDQEYHKSVYVGEGFWNARKALIWLYEDALKELSHAVRELANEPTEPITNETCPPPPPDCGCDETQRPPQKTNQIDILFELEDAHRKWIDDLNGRVQKLEKSAEFGKTIIAYDPAVNSKEMVAEAVEEAIKSVKEHFNGHIVRLFGRTYILDSRVDSLTEETQAMKDRYIISHEARKGNRARKEVRVRKAVANLLRHTGATIPQSHDEEYHALYSVVVAAAMENENG